MDSIGPEALDDRLDRNADVFVLDIRPQSEFASYNIAGSYNAPVYHEISPDGEALEPYLSDVPLEAEVVTVCRVGLRAADATRAFKDRGYDAVTLKGGIRSWRGYSEGTLTYRLERHLRDLFF